MTGVTAEGLLRRDGVRAAWGRVLLASVYLWSGRSTRKHVVTALVSLTEAVLALPPRAAQAAAALGRTCRTVWIAATAVGDGECASAIHGAVWGGISAGSNSDRGGRGGSTVECQEQFLRHALPPPPECLRAQGAWGGAEVLEKALRVVAGRGGGLRLGVSVSLLAALRRAGPLHLSNARNTSNGTGNGHGSGGWGQLLASVIGDGGDAAAVAGLLTSARILVKYVLIETVLCAVLTSSVALVHRYCTRLASVDLLLPASRKRRANGWPVMRQERSEDRLLGTLRGARSLVEGALSLCYMGQGLRGAADKEELGDGVVQCCTEVCGLAEDMCNTVRKGPVRNAKNGEGDCEWGYVPARVAACVALMVELCMDLVRVYAHIVGCAVPLLVVGVPMSRRTYNI